MKLFYITCGALLLTFSDAAIADNDLNSEPKQLRGSDADFDAHHRDLAKGYNERCRWPFPNCGSNLYCTRAGKNSKCNWKKDAGVGCGEDRECKSSHCVEGQCRNVCNFGVNCGRPGMGACATRTPPCDENSFKDLQTPCTGADCCKSTWSDTLGNAMCLPKAKEFERCENRDFADTCLPGAGTCKNTKVTDDDGEVIFECLGGNMFEGIDYDNRKVEDLATCATFLNAQRLPNLIRAKESGVSKGFGYGGGGGLIAGGSSERGIMYGRDGCFACYKTTCTTIGFEVGGGGFLSHTVASNEHVLCPAGGQVCSNDFAKACDTNTDCDGGTCDTCISLEGKTMGMSYGADVGPIGGAGWTSTDGATEDAALASGFTISYGFTIGFGATGETCNTKSLVAGCLDENDQFQRDLTLVRNGW